MKGEKKYLALTLALALGLLVLLGLSGGARPSTALAQSGTGIVRVATTGDDVPGCGSEAAPCRSVQHAVDEALPGEQIRVAGGVYTGANAYGGLAQVVYLSKTLALRGGYTLTNWIEPDPEANPTTLDAEGLGRVLVVSGTISATVEGLRLTGGDATGLGGSSGERDAGGGVYVYAAAATISNCLVYSNTASTVLEGHGGGLFLYYSDATLEGNAVTNNTASTANDGSGGGLYLLDSAATLSSNTVQDNVASTVLEGRGGGLFLFYGNATLEGNAVTNNTASTANDGSGGGLYLLGSAATLSGNTVQDNVASETSDGHGGGLMFFASDGTTLAGNLVQGNVASVASSGVGGGLWISESDITLEGNAIVSNTATLSPAANGWGGGLRVESGTTLTLTNNVVAGNQANAGAAGTGDGLWLNAGWGMPINGRLLHNTLADNGGPAGSGQGIYAGVWVTLTLSNTIVSGHEDAGVYAGVGSVISLEGTLWHGNGADTDGEGIILTGTVNVYGDPAFVDPTTGDYHLCYGSAAIDAGVDVGVTIDMDGDPRPIGLGYDMGADEYPAAGLYLAPDRSASVDPGTAITYTHTLTNVGAQSDAFALALDSSRDWATLLTATPITLAPAATATIQVHIAVPAGALSGTVDTTVLTATSQVDPSLHAAVTDATTARHVPGLSLAPDRTGSALPGEVVAYVHTLANTGNYTDVVTLTHASSQGWAVTYDTPFTLGTGQTATVAISVAVPAGALSGTVDTTVLTATSQADPGLHAAVADTTMVGGVDWTVYLPLVLKERP